MNQLITGNLSACLISIADVALYVELNLSLPLYVSQDLIDSIETCGRGNFPLDICVVSWRRAIAFSSIHFFVALPPTRLRIHKITIFKRSSFCVERKTVVALLVIGPL